MARTFEENLAVAKQARHTRFPLCSEGLDSMFGVVNMKDAWPLFADTPTNEALRRASGAVTYVDPKMTQDKILRELQTAGAHLACVRDANAKKVLGIVTLEEVLDALLGDLRERAQPRSPT
jgi:magnesium and cobalt exporter, CNNM family